MNPTPSMLVLLGPTAGGKSDLAVRLAEQYHGRIIGADSMQVYRQLDAATAKPSPDQMQRVKHELINVVDPTEPWTVADWLEQADNCIQRMQQQQILPIVVGGTNLYIKALLQGLFDGPPPDPDFRRALDDIDSAQLHQRLQPIDPEAAERIDPNDRKRIIRALEVHHATGQPISSLQQQWREQAEPEYRHNPILLAIDWPTDRINRRINARVKTMFLPPAGTEDLVSETRRLLADDQLGPQAREALGTKQVIAHLNGRYTLEQTIERIKIDTRRFAKSQRTWLRRFRGIHWLKTEHLSDDQVPAGLYEQARQILDPIWNPKQPTPPVER